MYVIEALRTSILEPHDHLHIKQMSAPGQGQIRMFLADAATRNHAGKTVGGEWGCRMGRLLRWSDRQYPGARKRPTAFTSLMSSGALLPSC